MKMYKNMNMTSTCTYCSWVKYFYIYIFMKSDMDIKL